MRKTKIIGILNVTPDSFSDGGLYTRTNAAVARAKQLLEEGADVIDIGGESTRPGSDLISAVEELKRVLPVIQAVKKELPRATLSIDTWKSTVAKEAIQAGCTIVNSLGGFTWDNALAAVIAEYNSTILMYHTKGMPKTMQQGEITYTDVVGEIKDFFEKQIKYGEQNGIERDKFIVDPGIGFGKTVEQNIAILKRLTEFEEFNVPLAIGVSRKSHIDTILQHELQIETQPTERLEGTLAETAIAVLNGASYVRTHDVAETNKFLTVLERITN